MSGLNIFRRILKHRIIIFICIVLLSISTYCIIKIYLIRKAVFQYEVTNSYNYNFKNSIRLKLENGKIALPENVDFPYTAFLKIYVKSTWLGSWKLPYVELKSNELSFAQYFERGCEGYRYVDISSVIQNGGKEIEITGRNIVIDNQTVLLTLFKNTDLSRSKILIISPHPDDAEISSYGLYQKYSDSFILTITAGESGKFSYNELYTDSLKHYSKKGQIRTWNSLTVPILAGISPENTLNLGFFDGTIKKMYEQDPQNVSSLYLHTNDINTFRKYNLSKLKDGLTGTSNWSSLVENLKFILSEINPDIIVTPYPAIDIHSDHRFSSIALFMALKELNIKNGTLFFYTNHFPKNEFYPFGETGSIISLPPNFNNDIYYTGIFSFTLDEYFQKDKTLALDAMNDLRPDTEWRFWDKSMNNTVKKVFHEIVYGKTQKDYFNRAVRSNELFFIVPVKDIYVDSVEKKLVFGNNNSFPNNTYQNYLEKYYNELQSK